MIYTTNTHKHSQRQNSPRERQLWNYSRVFRRDKSCFASDWFISGLLTWRKLDSDIYARTMCRLLHGIVRENNKNKSLNRAKSDFVSWNAELIVQRSFAHKQIETSNSFECQWMERLQSQMQRIQFEWILVFLENIHLRLRSSFCCMVLRLSWQVWQVRWME